MVTIYHNPRCSKSRETLALLQENGVTPTIVKYLENPPSAQTLRDITAMLSCSIQELIRSGEAIYHQLGLHNQSLSEAEWFDIVIANPQLLQRPIVINDNRAALGRPPQNVLSIL